MSDVNHTPLDKSFPSNIILRSLFGCEISKGSNCEEIGCALILLYSQSQVIILLKGYLKLNSAGQFFELLSACVADSGRCSLVNGCMVTFNSPCTWI